LIKHETTTANDKYIHLTNTTDAPEFAKVSVYPNSTKETEIIVSDNVTIVGMSVPETAHIVGMSEETFIKPSLTAAEIKEAEQRTINKMIEQASGMTDIILPGKQTFEKEPPKVPKDEEEELDELVGSMADLD